MHRRSVFFVWLVAFLTVWLYLVTAGNHWRDLTSQWGIALAMAVGSYFGASTPMGGGAVGFPVLVLLFGEPPAVGRDFSFAIQAVGMLSASLFIWVNRLPVAWGILGWAVAVGIVVVPCTTLWLVPVLPPLVVKLLFAVIWAGFGLVHALRWRQIEELDGIGAHTPRRDLVVGLALGLVGGVVSAVTGVGINMLLYMVLVMLLRSDARIAIPTSVLAMAALAITGIATRLVLGGIHPEVYPNWLAAAPVVVFGAPFGAWMVQLIPRATTLWIVSILCVGQFVWTCISERVTGLPLGLALVGVFVFVLAFQTLYRRGLTLKG
ncbi:MAG: sulfite exporter TauE/SafE family protein [Acidobacteriota bacterium]